MGHGAVIEGYRKGPVNAHRSLLYGREAAAWATARISSPGLIVVGRKNRSHVQLRLGILVLTLFILRGNGAVLLLAVIDIALIKQ